MAAQHFLQWLDIVYGSRHSSSTDGFMRATDVMLDGKRVGPGDVGKGCFHALQACMEGLLAVLLAVMDTLANLPDIFENIKPLAVRLFP